MFKSLTMLGLGAGLMYYLDPDRGRRRRALVRDQFVHLMHEADDAIEATTRDLRNRLTGVTAEAAHLFESDDAPDEVVRERVRSKMGRYVSNPSAIEVDCRGGHVALRGPILADEVEGLLAAVASVRGVTGVDNRLDVHQQPGDVPALQVGRRRTGERPELLQQNWSPTTRLLAGVAAGTLALKVLGVARAPGLLLGALGATMLVRGFDTESFTTSGGGDGGRRGGLPQPAFETEGLPAGWRR